MPDAALGGEKLIPFQLWLHAGGGLGRFILNVSRFRSVTVLFATLLRQYPCNFSSTALLLHQFHVLL